MHKFAGKLRPARLRCKAYHGTQAPQQHQAGNLGMPNRKHPFRLALLEYFASDSLSVAAPVLAAATLDARQWRALIAVADA